MCSKQISGARISNYIPQYLWDVITCPLFWYLLLAHTISVVGECEGKMSPAVDGLDMTPLIIWRHQMETFSALLAFCEGNPPATGGFLSQRPVTRSFADFFDLRLNKRLSKQSRQKWCETPSRSLWRHCNVRTLHLSANWSCDYFWLTLIQANFRSIFFKKIVMLKPLTCGDRVISV